MDDSLKLAEQEFARQVLPSKEARSFLRMWRRHAAENKKAWSDFRDAVFREGNRSTEGSVLISLLRQHLVGIQGGRCCYCRRLLQGIAYAKPIEHVLSRADYPQYTFLYRNLAVSCYDCNHSKKAKNWSGWKIGRKGYVPAGRCAKFFHPRLHKFDDHVRFLRIETNGTSISVYVGLTDQGRQICRDLLQHTAGRELLTSANKRIASAMEKLKVQIDRLEDLKSAEDLRSFMEALDDIAFTSRR